MKKAYLFFIYIVTYIAMAGFLCSCHTNRVRGNGNIVSQEISIRDYNELHIEGDNIELTYVQSDDVPYLKIETDQNIMDMLKVETDDKELTIKPKSKHTWINPTRFVITTNSTTLEEIKMAGGGNCNLGKGLTTNKLEISLAGGGTIRADSITVNRLECEIAGSGEINLSGKAENMDIKSAGSCTIKAFDLLTDNLTCKTAGSCEIEITANKEISAKMMGSGEIRYKGSPNIKGKSILGSGSITQVE
ncbi:head GIN domain-containing protein [Parabacteroides sp. AF17-28]|uniref:head GIN domain-containing protein n=2 Tax=Parabacteroides TaxID=375288 RepID=UPI000EFF3FFE|nr:head GIN domain-containing protein [Parabacteroides sp. AF17-28]RHR58241.1 DUF2807 domain-containing protein [Parabacteroides sp. AF17-28]